MAKSLTQGSERPNPPHTRLREYWGGGDREATGVPAEVATSQEKLENWQIGGNPWKCFDWRVRKGLTLPHTRLREKEGGVREAIGFPAEASTVP